MTMVGENDPGLRFEAQISALQADQNYKILNMFNRLDRLERRFRNFDIPNETREIVKNFRKTILCMFDGIDDGKDMRGNLIYINRRIVRIEKELAA